MVEAVPEEVPVEEAVEAGRDVGFSQKRTKNEI